MDYIQEYIKGSAPAHFLVSTESPTPRLFDGVRMQMHGDTGQGWAEILHISGGLYVTMTDYCLKHQMKTCNRNIQKPFHLGIMLSGHFDAQIPGRPKEMVSAGDVWCIQGSSEQTFTHHADDNICGISICPPQDLLESWLGTSSCAISKRLEKLITEEQARPLIKGLCHSSEIMQIARQLVNARRHTLSDKLHFESLALDFLSHILALNQSATGCRMERSKQTRAAVDEAVDILRRKWQKPPSISSLSRWVGINECYLKRGFRQQIGMSIGSYIRKIRMTKALEMIETGNYSILETALFVGYSNPGHFSTAFKKFHGRLPSYYLPGSGKTS